MMTQDPSSAAAPRWLRKLVIPGLIGAVAGFAASAAMLNFIDSSVVGGLGVSATIAALIGVLYAVIGLGIAAGLANPKAGARFLNVQDADDLRDQRKILGLSAATMVLWGVSLVALALAAPDGPVPQAAALVAGIGGLVIGTVFSVQVNRACDELMRAINLEAGAIGLALVQVVVGLWAVLAHLGLAAAPQPLDFLSLFYALLLAASFIAVGRRGMLTTP